MCVSQITTPPQRPTFSPPNSTSPISRVLGVAMVSAFWVGRQAGGCMDRWFFFVNVHEGYWIFFITVSKAPVSSSLCGCRCRDFDHRFTVLWGAVVIAAPVIRRGGGAEGCVGLVSMGRRLQDHRPDNAREYERIVQLGGTVVHRPGDAAGSPLGAFSGHKQGVPPHSSPHCGPPSSSPP